MSTQPSITAVGAAWSASNSITAMAAANIHAPIAKTITLPQDLIFKSVPGETFHEFNARARTFIDYLKRNTSSTAAAKASPKSADSDNTRSASPSSDSNTSETDSAKADASSASSAPSLSSSSAIAHEYQKKRAVLEEKARRASDEVKKHAAKEDFEARHVAMLACTEAKRELVALFRSTHPDLAKQGDERRALLATLPVEKISRKEQIAKLIVRKNRLAKRRELLTKICDATETLTKTLPEGANEDAKDQFELEQYKARMAVADNKLFLRIMNKEDKAAAAREEAELQAKLAAVAEQKAEQERIERNRKAREEKLRKQAKEDKIHVVPVSTAPDVDYDQELRALVGRVKIPPPSRLPVLVRREVLSADRVAQRTFDAWRRGSSIPILSSRIVTVDELPPKNPKRFARGTRPKVATAPTRK